MSFSSENKFGSNPITQIEHAICDTAPHNTVRTKKSAWEQFSKLIEMKYKLERGTSPEDIAKALLTDVKKNFLLILVPEHDTCIFLNKSCLKKFFF